MELPEFLTRDSDGYIHLTGHRIGLDDIVHFYNQGHSAEMLLEVFPTLSLALIHKVLGYYLDHQSDVDACMTASESEIERQRTSAARGPDLAELRRRLKAKQAAEA
jgi:uncharacterized protein (DUF433 family)